MGTPQVNTGALDRRQVRTLYEHHGAALLAYAISLLQDRAASEDVVQQVFLKLLRSPVFITGQPLHYLYRAIRNTALNHRRRQSREVNLSSVPSMSLTASTVSKSSRWTVWPRLATSSNGHWLESPPGLEEMGLALQSALRELPDEQREIIVLRVWGQMTFEEAAQALDIPPNTAASRYRYGLTKLRERLQPLAKEYGNGLAR